MCLGKSTCSVPASDQLFTDPCFNVSKHLAVQVECSGGTSATPVFTYAVTVPVGSTATVVLSAFGGGAKSEVTESGTAVWSKGAYVPGAAGITGATCDGKSIGVSVGSGRYVFTVATP